ncbi:MAG: Na/Pi cotransporter family protein [Treponemataceae bacterium]|nr:Na/Pi cotransporter family protein [Treponemataceae bacterium]
MILSVVTSIFNFVGALALLLWGMDLLSAGIQKGAGDKLQKLLSVVSGNRFTAVLTGLFVTAIIQSSSATTVMVVSFVNAQIISLTQAIGIIFGANIGTTVTAWIVSLLGFSFKISVVAIPFIGIGFFMKSLKNKVKDFGDMIMGFGLLFLGLDLLGDTLTLNPESVGFINGITNFGFWGIILGVLLGTVLTAVIHSSSAFTAIVITMAATGSLTWDLSAALVLGSNIGTTIDAILSSLGASTNAKRTALVHVLFNVFGTVLAIIFFKPLLALVDIIVPNTPNGNITNHIAMLHTVFNVCSTIIFLPFVNQLASLVTKLIKEPPVSEEEHYKVPVIISKAQNTIDVYVMQIEREVLRMAAKVMSMLESVYESLVGYDEKSIEEVSSHFIKEESYIDEMNEGISNFLMECFHMADTGSPIQLKIEKLIQVTNSIETLSDECATIIHKLQKYVLENSNHKSSSYEKLLPYMNQVNEFFDYVSQHLAIGLTTQERQLSVEMENNIDKTKKELKKLARYRIQEGKDVKSELHYIDIVRHVEKAGDCVFGIVKSL